MSSTALRRVWLLAVAAVSMGATAAHADEISEVKTLVLNVSGRIPQHCAIGEPSDMNFGDITRPHLSVASRVALNCNVPFEMTIRAERGGLAHNAQPSGEGPYAGTLPYTVGIEMPVRNPRRTMISGAFRSVDLMAGRSLSSGGGIATDGMAISVSLGQPSSEAGLLAGEYGETIAITIAPL